MAIQQVAVNRKALHDYEVLQRVEAGLSLMGSEIKSIRQGRVNLREAYARPDRGELWLLNAHIAKDAIAKVELALVRGRKRYDKRAAIASRDAQREIARALRRRN